MATLSSTRKIWSKLTIKYYRVLLKTNLRQDSTIAAHLRKGLKGKYATENGATKHFSKALDRKISESTVRRFKTNYLHALAEARSTTAAEPIVNSLPTKVQERPLLFGLKIDKAIQEYVEATRAACGVINTTIVMAAAVGIVSSRNITALRSHRGHNSRDYKTVGAISSQKNGLCEKKML